MKENRSTVWKIVLIIILYSLIRNWGDFKQGLADGFADGYQTAHSTNHK